MKLAFWIDSGAVGACEFMRALILSAELCPMTAPARPDREPEPRAELTCLS
jgi:hypothetical protein